MNSRISSISLSESTPLVNGLLERRSDMQNTILVNS